MSKPKSNVKELACKDIDRENLIIMRIVKSMVKYNYAFAPLTTFPKRRVELVLLVT